MDKIKRHPVITFIVCLLIPLAVGSVSSFLTMDAQRELFESIRRPPLQPPGIVFPIVWSILYLLMGLSSFFVLRKDLPDAKNKKATALTVYALSLILNFIWPLVFFGAEAFLPALFVLAALWISVFATILLYYRIAPLAAYLQVPYLLWLTFAAYLNYMVYVLNPR